MTYDCLIIDDEISIAETTSEYFNMFDVKTSYVTNYSEGIAFIKENEVSLLLLDINLGDESGFVFCKELRRISDMPVIFISARSSDNDILTALNIGGDDYITKPFTLSILLAKVKAVLKRSAFTANTTSDLIIIGHIQVDVNAQKVYNDKKLVKLKPMEFKLLSYFLKNRNRVITKDELLDNVWEDSFIGDGTLSVHIRHLREKVEINPNEPMFIKTIWGTGYIFEFKK